MIKPHDFIVQQTYADEGDLRWYVHEICFLDMGRFESKEAAEEHWRWLNNKYDTSRATSP